MESPISVVSGDIHYQELGKKNVVFGRPETGKTLTLSKLINEYIAEKSTGSGIAYLTYSRSMARQAKERFGLEAGRAICLRMSSPLFSLNGRSREAISGKEGNRNTTLTQ